MRRAAVVGLLLAIGLAVGIIVAVIGWSPEPAHEPTGVDWAVQVLVLLAAAMLIVSRVTGKR